LTESLARLCDSEEGWGKVRSLERFANLAMAQGQPRGRYACSEPPTPPARRPGGPLPPSEREECDRIIAAARSALDEGAFAVAWAEGRVMSLEQAVAYTVAREENAP
jgi:hypothetical protein